MDITELLKKEFALVNKAYFETESGTNFLRIEVNLREINKIAKLSSKISLFLDHNNPSKEIYYLDIFSPGTDIEFESIKSENYIGRNVLVKLKNNIKNITEFKGELLSFEKNKIIIKWNAKGQFRKQVIAIDNIELIKTFTSVKKK